MYVCICGMWNVVCGVYVCYRTEGELGLLPQVLGRPWVFRVSYWPGAAQSWQIGSCVPKIPLFLHSSSGLATGHHV